MGINLSPSFQTIIDEIDGKLEEKKFRWNQAHELGDDRLIEKTEADMIDFKKKRDDVVNAIIRVQKLFDL